MTTTSAPPGAGSTSVSPTARGLWRSGRGVLLIVGLIVAGAVTSVLLSGGSTQGRHLDPADTSLSGSHALARLLVNKGVTVHRVDDVRQAAQYAGADSQLLVTSASSLFADDVDTLAGLPGDRLIVGPVPYVQRLAPGIVPEGTASHFTRSRDPECALRAATRAGSAHMGGSAFTGPSGATRCYPSDGKPTLISVTAGGRTVTAVGSGEFMTNRHLAEDGNAALAMNLAGAKPTLIWIVAPKTPRTLAGPDGRSIQDMIPSGVKWGVLQLIVVVLLVAFWRGRRLGPVVAERLPVVVRAAETVEGRGRLYRARRARARAAEALRAGTLNRLVPRLGLSPGTGSEAVVPAVSARTGRDTLEVGAVLYGAAPADDAGLSALAEHLDRLERQVKDS
ncbi:DUF4350 domain-containing protein [Sinosporangium siamense]|uniref:Membrane protein n=1 Tax=Sinosporangium siamense TaxID=1367973 RepID=A0A919RBU1_9ACTN|nr:DUF4350 domain-containing protein [Sinosporangium siamense]GII91045.1 putative membrane protein [Sinosporangium siamense]